MKSKGRDFYVYLHRNAITGVVFYVGKGSKFRAYSKSGRGKWWKRYVAKYGYTIELVIEGLQEWYALELEIDLIAYYGRKNLKQGSLVNLSDGGEEGKGRCVSDETRKRQSHAIRSLDKTVHRFLNKTGEVFIGTRYEFYKKYGMDLKDLFSDSKSSVTCHNWTLLDEYPHLKFLADHNSYLFVHRTGESFTGTRTAFREKYGIEPKALFFIKDPQQTTYDWSLNFYKEYPNRKDTNVYTFTNKNGKVFHGTREDFKQEFNINHAPLFVYKTYKCWTLLDTYPKRRSSYDRKIYTFIHKNGEIFTGLRIELQEKYNIDICELFGSRGAKTCHGWRLSND